MDLSKIISIAGRSGLYRVVAQGRQALIAESLTDGTRMPVHHSMKVHVLDEISMYTTADDVPLNEIMENMYAKEGEKLSIDPKGDVELLYKKLGEVLPEYDRERIYASDVRKFFQWYKQLAEKGVLKELAQEKKKKDQEQTGETEEDQGAKAKAPAKKTAKPKKTAPKKNTAKGNAAPKKKPATTRVQKGSQRGG